MPRSKERMIVMAKRLAVFVYGLVSYLAFFLTFVYAVGFIGNLYVPKSMIRRPGCRSCRPWSLMLSCC